MITISEQQVREALPMAKAIELVDDCFRGLASGRIVNHPRRRVALANRAVLHYMAAGDNERNYLATKNYVTRPGVGAAFAVLLFDAEQARLLAAIEANALGQIRTGAASGVATGYLARADASTLGLIGCGFQAETQLEAIAAVRMLDRVKVFSRTRENRVAFAARMSARLGLPVEPVGSAEAAVRGSGILVTVTNARDPVVFGEWLEPGCHVNAAGSNHIRRREIDSELVRRAAVVAADSIEQAKMEAGDLLAAVQDGALDWERVVEFSAIAGGSVKGRSSPRDITLFESQGLAAEDLAVAIYVYEQLARPE
jgi:ornithine cyclodeaminase/alanine dehydrogenase-like protein (mu-crystallin family)